jgi:iron complex outermembrane recepter protein
MNRESSLSKVILFSAVAVGAIVAAPGWAAAQTGQGEVNASETIVVTATRRSESIQNVPLSVSAITEERIERLGARDTNDVVLTAPGVSFTDSGFGREEFVVRGVGSLGSGATTAIYIDEIPIPLSGGFTLDLALFDVDRVEVLRGPQGTLYGSSAMGGALRTITNQPDPNDWDARLNGSFSTTNEGGENWDFNGAVNVPLIGDRLAVRAVLYSEEEAGWVDNFAPLLDYTAGTVTAGPLSEEDVGTKTTDGGRISVRFTPTQDLALTGSYLEQRTAYDGLNSEDESFGFGALRQARLVSEQTTAEARIGNFTLNYDWGFADLVSSSSLARNEGFELIDLTLDFHFPGASVVQLLNDLVGDGTLITTIPRFTASQPVVTDSFTQEVRLSSKDDATLRWLIGVFYNDTEVSARQSGFAPTAENFFGALTPDDRLYFFNRDQRSEEISVFGELSFDLSERLTATLGARRYEVSSDYTITQGGLLFIDLGTLDPNSTLPVTTNSPEAQEDGFTYKAMLSYRVSDDILIYGGASSGYRPGGPNAPLPGGQTPTPTTQFSSDTLWQYEIGARTGWWENRLILNGALFYIDWSDIQAGVQTDGGFTFTTNLGEAHIAGAELELQARPADGWEFTAALTYLDAQSDSAIPSLGLEKGTRLAGIPEFQGNTSVTYTRPISGDLDWYVFGQYTYVDERKPVTNTDITLDAYDQIDLSAGLRGSTWDLSLFGRNLGDERGMTGRENRGVTRVSFIQPRTVGLSLRLNY